MSKGGGSGLAEKPPSLRSPGASAKAERPRHPTRSGWKLVLPVFNNTLGFKSESTIKIRLKK